MCVLSCCKAACMTMELNSTSASQSLMPDHVHMIFTPLVNQQAMEVCSLAEIMDAIKGASAHRLNKALGRKGRVWQAESFDHVVRCSEGLDAKIQYVLENSVRRG